MDNKTIAYNSYLGLNKLLSAQHPVSAEKNDAAHEEMLFIIVHQVYELWFKQILHEMDSVLNILNKPYIDERYLTTIVERCDRIKQIQLLLNQQISVLQTMTPMDFLNFRQRLGSASGFQSFQFRCLELKCGRQFDNLSSIIQPFSEAEQTTLKQLTNDASLFDCVNIWLENMPFLKYKDFDFWQSYQQATTNMLSHEILLVDSDNLLPDEQKQAKKLLLKNTLDTFESFLHPKEKNSSSWNFRFSQKAMLSALFIFLYRKEPILHLPYQFLSLLMDIDENLTLWRQKHMMMVQRMIGGKIGTGGSSGQQYLQSTIEKGRIFSDLFNISNFLLPSSQTPRLPKALRVQLDFNYSSTALEP